MMMLPVSRQDWFLHCSKDVGRTDSSACCRPSCGWRSTLALPQPSFAPSKQPDAPTGIRTTPDTGAALSSRTPDAQGAFLTGALAGGALAGGAALVGAERPADGALAAGALAAGRDISEDLIGAEDPIDGEEYDPIDGAEEDPIDLDGLDDGGADCSILPDELSIERDCGGGESILCTSPAGACRIPGKESCRCGIGCTVRPCWVVGVERDCGT